MTNAAVHRDLAAGRWRTLSPAEQMGNIGSEVERAIRAHAGGNQERWAHAFARALELFDLTASDGRWCGRRLREMLRIREEFCGLFYAHPDTGTAEFLSRYFLQFAVLARRGR